MGEIFSASDLFGRYADLYQQKFMDVSHYHESFDFFLSLLAPDSNLLELGCGPGNITRHLLDKRPDLKILATDGAPAMVELARQNAPEAETAVLDGRNLHEINKKFAGAMVGFLLPYLSRDEVSRMLADLRSMLVSPGVLYLSTMEGDYATSGPKISSTGDGTMMYFHEGAILTAQLNQSGFRVVYEARQPATNGTDTDLMLVAQFS